MKLSLKRKLSSFSILVVGSLFILFLLTSMYYYKKTTNRLNKQALKESTLLAAETINKELSLHLGTVRGLASNFGHTIDLG